MSIKIGTKRVIIQGEQVRKIVELSCMSKESLPKRYLEYFGRETNLPAVWERNGKIVCSSSSAPDLIMGEIYSEESFQKSLAFIKAAGDRLHDINKELAEANKDWNGDETFVI